jgi:non-specific serine/threonine protein kinase
VFEEGLAVATRLDDSWAIAHSVQMLGCALLALGESRLAAQRFHEGLTLARVVPLVASYCLDGLAAVAMAHGDANRAARLSGAAESMREDAGFLADRLQREIAQRTERTARATLGGDVWEVERVRGAAMSLDEAVAYALETCDA